MSEKKSTPDEFGSRHAAKGQGYYVPYPPEHSASGFDLGAAWEILLQRKVMITATTVAATVFFAVIAIISTPIYRAEVLLAPASTISDGSDNNILSSQFSGLASLVGANRNQRGMKDEALAVLRSRSFTGDFIESENLLTEIFSRQWIADENRWQTMEPDAIPTIADGYEVFDKKIRSVVEDETTGLVTLQIEWSDPELAAKWANTLVGRLNDHLRMEAIADANRRIDFLNAELEKTSVVELRQGIFNLIQTQVETAMLASVGDEYAFKTIDPAIIPESDRYVRPKRLLLVAIGILAGLLAGVFAALSMGQSRK